MLAGPYSMPYSKLNSACPIYLPHQRQPGQLPIIEFWTPITCMRPARFFLLLFFLALAWVTPSLAGKWVWVSQGDCPGPQVIGSAGVNPDDEQCTAAFAGKTALCFTQVCYPGCQYIDVATRQCQGGAELAEVYTCVEELPSPDGNTLGHAVPGR
jgi:hypothetical protein